MTSRAKGVSLAVLVALIATLWAVPSRADHDDGLYELPSIAQWRKSHLTVFIVPPAHGQIFNFETGVLNGNDPGELTPFNTYLKAIEDSIHAWEEGVQLFGAPWLKEAFRLDVYVLGRDIPPPGLQPDILVVTDENDPSNLGVAVRVIPCIVKMDRLDIVSLTYADMFNVSAQEFGHCLGLRHVGSQGGVDPLSDLKHPEHDVMNGFYTHFVGDEGTHLHCVSNLNVIALEYVFSVAYAGLLPSGGPSSISFMPVGAYGSTCEPPPADWRDKVPTGGTFQPPPADESPEPDDPGVPTDEPSATTTITSPTFGESRDRGTLRRIRGTASWTGDGEPVVLVALYRKAKGACSWWSAERRAMVAGACDSFLWNEASGTSEWGLKISPRSLPRGRYKVLARTTLGSFQEGCCESGRNMIDFRLR